MDRVIQKMESRVSSITSAKSSSMLSLHVYTTKVQSVPLYKSQLLPIPSSIIQYEWKWLHSILRLPWCASGKNGIYNISCLHAHNIQAFEVSSKAAMTRAAINNIRVLEDHFLLLRDTCSEHIPFAAQLKVTCPLPGGIPPQSLNALNQLKCACSIVSVTFSMTSSPHLLKVILSPQFTIFKHQYLRGLSLIW